MDGQTYFGFTRPGALEYYNTLLRRHIRGAYLSLLDVTQNPHYMPNEDAFKHDWLKSVNHKIFAKKYSPIIFDETVERQNDKVRSQFDNIETLVLQDEEKRHI